MSRYLATNTLRLAARQSIRPQVITRTLASVATAAAPSPSQDYETSSAMPGQVRTTEQWQEFGKTHVAHGLGRLKNEVMLKGEGLKITAADGKEYLDFTAGIGVTNLGHCHPRVTAAAQAQVAEFVHLQCSIGFHQPYLNLISRLLPIMPHPSLDTFFFWNSGSEAVEMAIKLARRSTGRQNIIVMQGSYHGRTFGASSLTKSKTIYSQGTGSGLASVFTTPFPYWHSMGLPVNTPEEELVRQANFQLDLLFKQQSHPSDTAAIFVEPVIGEGGYVPAPAAYMAHLRKRCDEHGIMLVCDEVQSGFGRTGTMFCVEGNVEGTSVRPDIMIFAKGLANGFPLSGVVSRKELMDLQEVGSIGGTYAGNPVSCAAAVAVTQVFEEDNILANVVERSKQMFSALDNLRSSSKTSHLVADIRGKGLMVAIEFTNTADDLTTAGLDADKIASIPSQIGKRVQEKCIAKGLMILTTSCFDTVRFIPALVISEEEMRVGMEIFSQSLEEVAREG